ncbi:hypothetical protein [Sorangium sp. So ce1389]|uniref:hypothetical protein n=1 Tax=Sorangium sp. So ce1389 TaxID=3133336 RepID=UPI003F5DF3C9
MSNDTRCGILRHRCNARHSSLAAEGRCDDLAHCGAALLVAVVTVVVVAAPARDLARVTLRSADAAPPSGVGTRYKSSEPLDNRSHGGAASPARLLDPTDPPC